MPTPRFGHTASSVDGTIYVIGGGSGSKQGPYLSTVEAYDPAANTWTTKTPMPTGRSGHAACVVDGNIYVVGGEPTAQASLATLEMYDPATDSWATKADAPTPRTFHCACAVNGKIYVFCGTGTPNPSGLDVYDPANDEWATTGVIPNPRALAAACVVDNKIYVFGGIYGNWFSNPPQRTVEEYDPATDTWTTLPNMNSTRMFHAATAFDGKLHAVGGTYGVSSTIALYERCDPATGAWEQKPSIRYRRSLLAACVVDGRLFAIGGTRDSFEWRGTRYVETFDLRPIVTMELDTTGCCISWTGTLQVTDELSGLDWQDVEPAPTSPWIVELPPQDTKRFYRARVASPEE